MTILIEKAIEYWKDFPREVFLQFKLKTILIKFRDSSSSKRIFNEVEPIQGLRFIDVLGTEDYFLGEFILINNKLWKITKATKAIVLSPKSRRKSLATKKLRDDGFIKTYTSEKSIIITLV